MNSAKSEKIFSGKTIQHYLDMRYRYKVSCTKQCKDSGKIISSLKVFFLRGKNKQEQANQSRIVTAQAIVTTASSLVKKARDKWQTHCTLGAVSLSRSPPPACSNSYVYKHASVVTEPETRLPGPFKLCLTLGKIS